MHCFILCRQRKVLLCSLAIVLLVHMTMLLNSLHTISHIHLWTQFPLTNSVPAGTESGVGSKPSVTMTLTVAESGVVTVGTKPSVTRTLAGTESGVVTVGTKPSVMRTLAGTESGVVTVGTKPSVTRTLAGTESGVVTVGTKPSVTLANGSREVYTTPCSPSSLLYWPNDQQWTIQPLFSKREASVFVDKIRSLRVVSLEKGCSSTSTLNRLATLEDGTKVCCRILQIGNIYSYHLNWLLGLRNIPPITAVKLNLRSERWKSVHDVAKAAKWHDRMLIITELFIDNLTEVYNLPYFSNNEKSILTVPVAEKLPLTPVARKMMVEWSDMILFDFLTGHTDRKIFNDHKQPVKNL